jgi:zinc protease
LTELDNAINEELSRLLDEGPTADELERGRAQAEAQFVYRLQTLGGFGGKSDQLNAYSVFLNDPGFFERDLARYERVSAQDLHSVAKQHLRQDRRVVLSVVPRGKPELALSDSTPAVVS